VDFLKLYQIFEIINEIAKIKIICKPIKKINPIVFGKGVKRKPSPWQTKTIPRLTQKSLPKPTYRKRNGNVRTQVIEFSLINKATSSGINKQRAKTPNTHHVTFVGLKKFFIEFVSFANIRVFVSC